MKHGDIVRVDGRLAVAIKITPKDMKRYSGLTHGDNDIPVDVRTPGVYAFAGYWYADGVVDLLSFTFGGYEVKKVPDPLNCRSYGKILAGPGGKSFTVGRVKDHFQIKSLRI